MTTPLFTPPPLFALPLTKGGDVDFIYKPMVTEGGEPVLSNGLPQYEIADFPHGLADLP